MRHNPNLNLQCVPHLTDVPHLPDVPRLPGVPCLPGESQHPDVDSTLLLPLSFPWFGSVNSVLGGIWSYIRAERETLNSRMKRDDPE